MLITGYYDGTAVQISSPLPINQKVIVIPIEDESTLWESAAVGLHQYANISLIDKEKDAWKEAAGRKHALNGLKDLDTKDS